MKHFMVCINPECDQPFHEVSASELAITTLMQIPVALSLDGSELSLELAAVALEDFLEVATQNNLKDMAYEKLKATQVLLSQKDACSCPGCSEGDEAESTSVNIGELSISPSTASDDYYQSSDYKAHRIRMDELEVERVKADILHQQAQTKLVEAKARLTIAEAESIEQKFRPSQRNTPQAN